MPSLHISAHTGNIKNTAPRSQRARLTDTARLRDSIDYAATPTKVMVGSNLPYARIHQYGGTIRPKKAKRLIFKGPGGEKIVAKQVTIPARPYLGVSKADMEEVRATMEDFLKGAFKE